MNEYSIDSVLKREFPELKDDNSKSFRISKELFIMVAKHSREMVKFAKDEWDKAKKDVDCDAIRKLNDEIAALKSKKAGVELTKEQVIDMIRASAEDGNAGSQKILSEYIGLGRHDEDMVVQMVDYANAPEWYKTRGLE